MVQIGHLVSTFCRCCHRDLGFLLSMPVSCVHILMAQPTGVSHSRVQLGSVVTGLGRWLSSCVGTAGNNTGQILRPWRVLGLGHVQERGLGSQRTY